MVAKGRRTGREVGRGAAEYMKADITSTRCQSMISLPATLLPAVPIITGTNTVPLMPPDSSWLDGWFNLNGNTIMTTCETYFFIVKCGFDLLIAKIIISRIANRNRFN